jgi:ankyrin repeat protein
MESDSNREMSENDLEKYGMMLLHDKLKTILGPKPSLAITPLQLEKETNDTNIYSRDTNWKFSPGVHPIHGAAWDGNAATVRMILDIDKVDANVEDAEKEVPLHYAALKTIQRQLLSY